MDYFIDCFIEIVSSIVLLTVLWIVFIDCCVDCYIDCLIKIVLFIFLLTVLWIVFIDCPANVSSLVSP